MNQFQNLDAESTVFFRRELERIKSRVFETQYQDLQFRKLFPVDNEGGLGVESITVVVFDRVGMAKIVSGYANDLPRVDVAARESTVPVRTIGASFGYNVQEIAAAKMTGKPLQQRRANAAGRAIEEKLNDIAFNGDADYGLIGFLDNPNIPVSNVVNGAGGNSEWTTKTPDEILFDINDTFAEIHEITKMKERPSRLLLPVAQWNYIVSTPRASNSDTTILAYVVKNSPYLTSMEDVIPVVELAGAGPTGGDVMIAYDPNPDKLEMDIPYEMQMLAPQERDLEYVVPALARSGGVNLYYPLSVNMKEGI